MLGGMKNALPHLIAEAEYAASRLVSSASSVVLDVLSELTIKCVKSLHYLAFVLAVGDDKREDASNGSPAACGDDCFEYFHFYLLHGGKLAAENPVYLVLHGLDEPFGERVLASLSVAPLSVDDLAGLCRDERVDRRLLG